MRANWNSPAENLEMAAVVSRSARRLLGFSRQVSCPKKFYFTVQSAQWVGLSDILHTVSLPTLHIPTMS